MKIVTDKHLYICSVVCGLLLVYFISVYILLVIVVFISFLYYVSHPTSSLKLRTVNLLSNLWHSSSVLTSFDSMYHQNSLATYRLHRNRTFNNPRRSSNTLSSRENDTENTSFGAYSCEYDSEGFAYRRSDETAFNKLKMNSPTPNGSFSISRSSTSSNSPWGISVSPMLRNRTSDVKTLQTVAGPLLASTRFNRSLDSGLLGNVSSPGLSSRIAHSARENAEVLTHQKKYDRPGDFPLVQLDRSASRLQTLSPRNTHKLSRRSVTVRIAPPESSELRYSALLDRSPQSFGGMDHDTSPNAEMNTKSLLEVLKEISRKRIHAQMEEKEGIKRQCKGETSLANSEQPSRLTSVLDDVSGCKRMREESPEEQNVEQMNQSKKRINNNNEILSSLSSSRNLLKFMKKSAKKRKSTAELLANSAPVAKKQSRLESPSDPAPVSASDTAPNSNKQNTSSVDTMNSPTSSSKSIDITVSSSPTEMHDPAKFSDSIQMKSYEKSSSTFVFDEDIPQQRMKLLVENVENEEVATNTRSARFSLSRAPTVPVRRTPIFSEEKVAESTKITSEDSKTSNTEVKDSNISVTKSPSAANVFGLVSSVPNTTLHNTSTTSVVSVSASASIAQTSTTQCTSSATPVQSSSLFSGLTSPTLVASSLNTSLKTSADQSTANSEQPTTKTGISISQSFVSSTSTSNANAQTFPISLPIQSSMSINFGATQTTAAIPNSLSSVKSSIFAISSAEQLIQTSGLGTTTNAPSNGESVVQVSAVSSNNSSNNNNNNKSAEMRKPSSPQLIFGAVSSVKDTIAIGSPQVQSTQAATLFSSSQVQSTQASPLFGSSPLGQSTQFNSPQVQSTQATVVFGSATSTQSNPVFPISNSSIQATTESGFTASQPSVSPKSLFSVPQTSQQTSAGGMFPSVQSSALFGTSPSSSSSSLQPQSTLSFGGSATTEAAQTSVFGSKKTDLFKTSANQSVQGGKLFGISSSLGVQPAQTATVFSSSPAGTTIQASVFGNSGTTQTTAGSNILASTSAVSSAQSEVKFGINAQSSTTLQTKSSFVLPSASIAFGSSVSPAQNAGGFQIAKPTLQSDSGVGTSASSTASSGFGSVSSKPSHAQNTFAFGGATPSSAASQTTSIFGNPTLQVTPKSSAQISLSFGTSTSQSSGIFSTPQSGTVMSGGFGAFSGSLAKTTTESNAATGKNLFASAASAANNTPVFGTQTTNAISVFGGTKTDEKPPPFGFGSAKSNDSSTNIFQSNATSNQSNVGGFKFEFTSPSTTKENTAGTSSSQTTTPAFQFGAPGESKPAFGFGGASSINNTLKPASGGFGSNLFGSTPITTSSTTPQSNVFAFGGAANPSSGSASSTNNTFGFGAASSAPSTSGAFTFGSTSQPSSSNVFGFGSAQTTTSTAQNASGGGGLFNTGTAQNASGGGGLFNTGTAQNASGGGGLFNTGTAHNASGGGGLFNTGTAQNASGGGGLFNTGTPPAFQFGNAPNQAGSTAGFGFGNAGSSATPVNFAAGPSSSSSTFQTGSTAGFGFGSPGPSTTSLNFTAGPSSSSSTFQPGTTGNMFSIGSGSTGPRARTRTSRRQR